MEVHKESSQLRREEEMMAYTQANHLLPFEVFLLMMLLEEHKEVRRIRNILAEFQFKR